MLKTLGIAAIGAICAAPAMAKTSDPSDVGTAAPMRYDFDLAAVPGPGAMTREDACPEDPVLPRNTNLRGFAPPNVQMQLADNGPIVSLGAMGARFKNAPRLAHIAIGMNF